MHHFEKLPAKIHLGIFDILRFALVIKTFYFNIVCFEHSLDDLYKTMDSVLHLCHIVHTRLTWSKRGGGGEKVSENSAAEINQISVSVMFCIFFNRWCFCILFTFLVNFNIALFPISVHLSTVRLMYRPFTLSDMQLVKTPLPMSLYGNLYAKW